MLRFLTNEKESGSAEQRRRRHRRRRQAPTKSRAARTEIFFRVTRRDAVPPIITRDELRDFIIIAQTRSSCVIILSFRIAYFPTDDCDETMGSADRSSLVSNLIALFPLRLSARYIIVERQDGQKNKRERTRRRDNRMTGQRQEKRTKGEKDKFDAERRKAEVPH